MSAKEMFEELGFECSKNEFSIRYYKEFRDYDDSYTLDIDCHWFWQRERVWKEEYEYLTYLQVIKPINDILMNK